MKTMTFQARELKEALAKVKQELGPDAMIVSTRQVNPLFGFGQPMLEVVAAAAGPSAPDDADGEAEAEAEAHPQKGQARPAAGARPAGVPGAQDDPTAAAFDREFAALGMGPSSAPRRPLVSRLLNRVGPRATPGAPSMSVGGGASPQTDGGHASHGHGHGPGRGYLPVGQNPGWRREGAAKAGDAGEADPEAALEARLLPLQREVRALRSQLHQVTQSSAALSAPSLKQEVDELRQVLKTMSLGNDKTGDLTSEVARLINLGVERPRAEALWARAREIGGDPETALGKAVAERITTAGPVGVSARVAAFIGPTGVGKTTTIAKIAARAALIDGAKVALLTIDTFRVGAIDQLQRYADLMELPLHVAGTSTALKAAVQSNAGADLILLDTAGRGPRDVAQLAALRELLGSADGVEVHLCLSATTRAREQALAVQSYRPLHPTRLCVTKLDEALGLGEILNIHETARLPLSYFGIGQRVPEDLELCTPEGFARRFLQRPPAQSASAEGGKH